MKYASDEEVDDFSIQLFKILETDRIDPYEMFAILIGVCSTIGHDAGLPEDEMVSLLKLGILENKKLQRMEMQ